MTDVKDHDECDEDFPSELYNHFVDKRINLAILLSKNMDMLEYDTIANVVHNICKHNNASLFNLMSGKIGGQHNSRMSISVFPTWNLFHIIVKILNKLSIHKLEDIGSGVGLIPYMFKKFNYYLLFFQARYNHFLKQLMHNK